MSLEKINRLMNGRHLAFKDILPVQVGKYTGEIDSVDNFTYLGSSIRSDNKIRIEVILIMVHWQSYSVCRDQYSMQNHRLAVTSSSSL